ncbi:NHL domain-containing protein [Anthocerotibacter panamensis]|uniref:NHL domain-containing protein n=1 Tax=Anthocerotibacter panamensis TaxID=2857077 RepID=UPI001C4032D5|nr:SMP-30/gluconolactonase/LRE family protein [Anthocerotibacter panamensis]
MRQLLLWSSFGLGFLFWVGGLVLPEDRQEPRLLHWLTGGTPAETKADLPQWRLSNFAYPVALLAKGKRLWVVDHNNNRLLLATPDIVRAEVGNGQTEASGDGGPAALAGVFPLGIARDEADNLYIADHLNHRIRKVDPKGIITTVAGNGQAGLAGDGGPATDAQLNDPSGVAVDRAGTIYIADQDNKRVRQVKQGIITTLPTESDPPLKTPWGLALDCHDRLIIVDLGRDQIRRWDGQQLAVLAGDGKTGFKGDGGPATEAQLNSPAGVAVSCVQGREELYIADSGNDRVRKVDSQGHITTVAGDGKFGYSGDRGPARKAQLASPYGVALDAQGNLYIADANNNRVRRVNPQGIIETVLSPGGLEL